MFPHQRCGCTHVASNHFGSLGTGECMDQQCACTAFVQITPRQAHQQMMAVQGCSSCEPTAVVAQGGQG